MGVLCWETVHRVIAFLTCKHLVSLEVHQFSKSVSACACVCMCVSTCVLMCACVCTCVRMCSRSMNIWMYAIITYTEARTGHGLFLCCFPPQLVTTGPLTEPEAHLSDFLADQGALNLHLAVPPILGPQAHAVMLITFSGSETSNSRLHTYLARTPSHWASSLPYQLCPYSPGAMA